MHFQCAVSLCGCTCVRLKALYIKHYNNTQPNLITHYISHSVPPSPPASTLARAHPLPPAPPPTHTRNLATPLPPPFRHPFPHTPQNRQSAGEDVSSQKKQETNKTKNLYVQHPVPVKGLDKSSSELAKVTKKVLSESESEYVSVVPVQVYKEVCLTMHCRK